MLLFKISAICTIILNVILIPLYIMKMYFIYNNNNPIYNGILYLLSYAAVISAIFFTCISAVRIRSGFKGTRLVLGNRHLHEGTIGIVFVFIGVVWNIWHWFDTGFLYGIYFMVGWVLSVVGLVWIIIGAILIGRDWEDIKKGHFFNKEEE